MIGSNQKVNFSQRSALLQWWWWSPFILFLYHPPFALVSFQLSFCMKGQWSLGHEAKAFSGSSLGLQYRVVHDIFYLVTLCASFLGLAGIESLIFSVHSGKFSSIFKCHQKWWKTCQRLHCGWWWVEHGFKTTAASCILNRKNQNCNSY